MLLVSIITPNYNGANHISECIRSVINQSYVNWELIIVDDKSTDNSIDIIKQFVEKDARIRFYQNANNSGVLATRNKAIQEAKGDIIAFLDSDDIWCKDKLKEQIELYEKDKNIALVFSDYEHMKSNGEFLKTIKSPKVVNYKMLLKTCHMGCLTVTYNVKILGKRYFFHEGHEDYALWLSIMKEGFNAINVGKVLAKYRKLDKSISSNKLKTAKWQWLIYRDVEKLNIFKSAYYFLFYAYHAVKKHK